MKRIRWTVLTIFIPTLAVTRVGTQSPTTKPAFDVASVIAPGKAWERGIEDEHMKPLDGVQLVKIQSGQRRSGQAGSESCTCVG